MQLRLFKKRCAWGVYVGIGRIHPHLAPPRLHALSSPCILCRAGFGRVATVGDTPRLIQIRAMEQDNHANDPLHRNHTRQQRTNTITTTTGYHLYGHQGTGPVAFGQLCEGIQASSSPQLSEGIQPSSTRKTSWTSGTLLNQTGTMVHSRSPSVRHWYLGGWSCYAFHSTQKEAWSFSTKWVPWCTVGLRLCATGPWEVGIATRRHSYVVDRDDYSRDARGRLQRHQTPSPHRLPLPLATTATDLSHIHHPIGH